MACLLNHHELLDCTCFSLVWTSRAVRQRGRGRGLGVQRASETVPRHRKAQSLLTCEPGSFPERQRRTRRKARTQESVPYARPLPYRLSWYQGCLSDAWAAVADGGRGVFYYSGWNRAKTFVDSLIRAPVPSSSPLTPGFLFCFLKKNVLQGQHEADKIWSKEGFYAVVIFLSIFVIIVTCLMVSLLLCISLPLRIPLFNNSRYFASWMNVEKTRGRSQPIILLAWDCCVAADNRLLRPCVEAWALTSIVKLDCTEVLRIQSSPMWRSRRWFTEVTGALNVTEVSLCTLWAGFISLLMSVLWRIEKKIEEVCLWGKAFSQGKHLLPYFKWPWRYSKKHQALMEVIIALKETYSLLPHFQLNE